MKRIDLGNRNGPIQLINRDDELVKYFTDRGAVSQCDAIFNNMKSSKFIAKGKQGSVSTIELGIPGDTKEYVVKKSLNSNVTIQSHDTKDLLKFLGLSGSVTYEKVFDVLPEEMKGMSRDAFYEVNGVIGRSPLKRTIDTIKRNKFDRGACKVSTSSSVSKYWVSNGVKYEPLEKPTMFTYPIGSYLCFSDAYTEYVIGLLCANLVRTGKCINFVDMYGFSLCSPSPTKDDPKKGIYDYTFMEKIHGSVRKNLKDVELYETTPEDLIDGVIIQTFFAISVMQRIHGIQHNDLHLDNVMFQDLSKVKGEVVFNGRDLKSADFFSYDIDGVKVYFRNCGVIVKLADFGFAMKYAHPIVGPEYVADGDIREIPAWRDDFYDAIFTSGDMYYSFREKSALINRMRIAMFDPYIVLEDIPEKELYNVANDVSKKLEVVYEQKSMRPSFVGLTYHPWEYLTNPDVMAWYLTPPPKGSKVVSLGTLNSKDYHPQFFDGNEKPLKPFTSSELERGHIETKKVESDRPSSVDDLIEDAAERIEYGLEDKNAVLIVEGILGLEKYIDNKRIVGNVKRKNPNALDKWKRLDDLVYYGMNDVDKDNDVKKYFSPSTFRKVESIKRKFDSLNAFLTNSKVNPKVNSNSKTKSDSKTKSNSKSKK